MQQVKTSYERILKMASDMTMKRKVSQEVSVMVVNAFTYNGEGGNPAGVVLNADEYSQAEKQEIARLAGYPETAFVSQSDVADRNLEFFTPNKQIAHCGHATVGTFCYLNQIGEVNKRTVTRESVDGVLDVILEDDMAFMEQKPAFINEVSDQVIKDVMASLSLQVSDLKDEFRPAICNSGVSFMIIPLKDIDSLKRIETDLKAINEISEAHDIIGFYAYAMDAVDDGHDVTTRMFAPRYAIPEEPATGMAAGILSYYLNEQVGYTADQIVIEQGYFMDLPSKSEIIVKLIREDGKLKKVMAGGRAKLVTERYIVL